jgi:hypothetical protein
MTFAEVATVLFDTDILIWVQRRNLKAAHLVDRAAIRHLSILSYMELMQCAKNKDQLKIY